MRSTTTRACRGAFGRSRGVAAVLVAVLLLAGGAAHLAGCEARVEAAGPAEPVMPPEPDLSTPENAARSYLDWVSLSYRLADSELSTRTMTPEEGVRVDSYIELNRQKGRAIEQRLEGFEVRSLSEEGTSAVVAAAEEWRYRYFSIDTLRYVSSEHTVSYETTYTLTRVGEGWLVDKVEAEPLTPVE
ncbi:MAG: hypothetical protein IBX62_07640 [Coriobacteriia bacterium]|nr:hypothetical protein [Coriobacteriia bacterium]